MVHQIGPFFGLACACVCGMVIALSSKCTPEEFKVRAALIALTCGACVSGFLLLLTIGGMVKP